MTTCSERYRKLQWYDALLKKVLPPNQALFSKVMGMSLMP